MDIVELDDSDEDLIGIENNKFNKRRVRTYRTRYQRIQEMKNIEGFIVNIHDVTNYDIDLDIPRELVSSYSNIVSNVYKYCDLDEKFMNDPNCNLGIEEKVGTAYRCRIKGIGTTQLLTSNNTWKSNKLCIDIRKLIDRSDSWVTCCLSDVDIYKRLLVDITVHTPTEDIDLREYILEKSQAELSTIYFPYYPKRSSKTNDGFLKDI